MVVSSTMTDCQFSRALGVFGVLLSFLSFWLLPVAA